MREPKTVSTAVTWRQGNGGEEDIESKARLTNAAAEVEAATHLVTLILKGDLWLA